MRAIYIPSIFDPSTDLEKLNQDLKDCHNIVWEMNVNEGSITGGFMCYGKLMIVDNYTRKDKLKKLKKISNEKGTSDNSI